MTPALTSPDVKQLRPANRVVAENFFNWTWIRKNCADLISGQFCARISFSSIGSPPLRNAIGIVIGESPKKKMGWVTAWRIIASMQNIHAFRYFAFFDRPRHSVGKPMFTLGIKTTIPINVTKAAPQPAFILRAARDLPPESALGVLRNHALRLAYCMGVD